MAESVNHRKQIFLDALAIASLEQRAVFLGQCCRGDDVLRQEIEAMLAAHGVGDSFLEKPAAALGATVDANGEPPMAAVLPDEQIGKRIGPYKLLEQIGEGGMGAVYMAEQQEPVRRLVALKIIKPGMDSGQILARFEAERQALALMDHPNIAKVLDAGATPPAYAGGSPLPYFVMELVKGTPITKFCDERRLAMRERLELFVAVCQAIQHAHQKGIIHRDIKPSNVLIALYDDKPVPKVIDFGIAKAAGQPLTDRTLQTGFGAIVGTPEYMSPEQATFNQLDIDTRSDVYALGVLLYELLTGTTPVDKTRLKEAALLEILRLVREDEPPRPSVKLSTTQARGTIAATRGTDADKLSQLLRGELDWIVMKSLEKDRNRRYDTAASLARDVERYLKDEMVEARPPSVAYRLQKAFRKNRGLVVAASLVSMALLGGLIGTTLAMTRAWDAEAKTREDSKIIQANLLVVEGLNHDVTKALVKAEKNEKAAEKARDEALQAKADALKNEKEATHQALRADTSRHSIQMDAIFRAWERDDMETATRILGETPEAFRKTWEYRYLRGLCHRKALPMQFLGGLLQHNGPRFPTMSPDGKTVAVTHRAQKSPNYLKVFDAATGQEKWSFEEKDSPFQSIYSRDSKLIAFLHAGGGGYSITICDLETGQQRLLASPGLSGVGGVPGFAFSPDGKFLAATVFNGVVVLDVATGKNKYCIQEPKAIQRVAFSDDGKLLAASGIALKIYDAENGAEKITVSTGPDDLETYVLSFSPDSKHLLAQRAQPRFASPLSRVSFVKVWDTQTGKERFGTQPKSNFHADDAGFTADGKAVVLVGGIRDWINTEPRWIKILDLESGKEMPATIPLGRTTCKSLDLDGRRVVVYDRKNVYLWVLAQTPLEMATLEEQVPGFSWRFTPDNKHIFTWYVDRFVTTWDADTGRKLRSVKMDPDRGILFMGGVSPDGKRAACCPEKSVKVYDAATGQEQFAVVCRSDIYHVVFSPDGQRFVAVGPRGDTVGVWDTKTLREVFSVEKLFGYTVAFSPDGGQIAARTRDDAIGLWEAGTGKKTLTIPAHGNGVMQLLIFPDGKRLLSRHYDGETVQVKIWDVGTAKELGSFLIHANAHVNENWEMFLSPDATRLFCGNKIFDVATGQEVFAFPSDIKAVAMSADGRRIVAANRGKTNRSTIILEAP